MAGMIYEIYILPEFRRSGIATVCATEAIRELQAHAPSKIQLEVVEGRVAAAALWESLGFQKVTGRYVLPGGAQVKTQLRSRRIFPGSVISLLSITWPSSCCSTQCSLRSSRGSSAT